MPAKRTPAMEPKKSIAWMIAVDGPAREATFRRTNGDGISTEHTEPFDMLHVVPPQRAPQFVRDSELANEAGWVAVDEATLQHPRFANVFSLGDACGASNAKTAAAVRKLLTHPAARGGEALREASTLLVHLSGEEMTMAEIVAVTGAIGSHATTANLVVGASGPGRDGVGLQVTVVIAHAAKLAEPGQEQHKAHPDPTGQASGLGFSGSFSVPDTGSYLDLGKDTGGTSRGGFAYTPPAPTADALTP